MNNPVLSPHSPHSPVTNQFPQSLKYLQDFFVLKFYWYKMSIGAYVTIWHGISLIFTSIIIQPTPVLDVNISSHDFSLQPDWSMSIINNKVVVFCQNGEPT